MTQLDRFWAKVDKQDNGHWLWTGCKNRSGYGTIHFDGKKRLAHRVSYVLHAGPIPNDLPLDHLCRVRACVNPDHLEPVTPAENTHRGESPSMIRARSDRCKNGHEFTPDNTGWNNGRRCRQCHREYEFARKAANPNLTAGGRVIANA